MTGKVRNVARKNTERCLDCGACRELVACPDPESCAGCGACALACPHGAVDMVPAPDAGYVTVEFDGEPVHVPAGVTVARALEEMGLRPAWLPGEGFFMPCRTGGCWTCALEVDGEVRPACLTAVREGTRIRKPPPDAVPKRLVGGFTGHPVGGVGTPWWLKGGRYIEVACFAAGCNFRCPQCQNWTTTYASRGRPLTPREAAYYMTLARRRYGVDRMAISGGECTLNRRWLMQYLRELKRLNPDADARLHVDTNGSLLTPDYIQELVAAGMTDVGVDLKALDTRTFMRITGLADETLAERYRETAWQAVEYLLAHHPAVFVGIGIPYNRDLISLAEVEAMGRKIAAMNPEVQVCVLDYRPEFRARLARPSPREMMAVHETLRGAGLRTVVCQTELGHIGPDGRSYVV